METRRPLIVEVKRGSLDDGPGIRTVVFFKGCPLRCAWCHNPETQETGAELAFAAERCLKCGACAMVCPNGLDRARCQACGRCAAVCPSGARRLIGEYWPPDTLIGLLLRDRAFYRHSNGGITLSGGEATMFPDYLNALLAPLKAAGVHIALETSGCFDYEVFAAKVLPYLDLVLYDVKHTANLRRLLRESTVEVRPRIALVPGLTDTREHLAGVVAALREAGARGVEPLPYNPLGLSMYARLGRTTPGLPAAFVPPDREQETLALLRELATSDAGGSALRT